jgi:hypothetical protein
MIQVPYQIEEKMKKIKTRELWKKKKKRKEKKNNQNFFTLESVPATFSSRLCHHLLIIVKLLFLQTWVGVSKYEGGEVRGHFFSVDVGMEDSKEP